MGPERNDKDRPGDAATRYPSERDRPLQPRGLGNLRLESRGTPGQESLALPRRTQAPAVTLGSMNSLFDPGERDRVLARIGTLRAESPRGWGKMDVAQALAHCRIGIDAATGNDVLPRSLLAKVLGRLFRGMILSPKPFSKNSPTHPKLVISDPHDFAREQERLAASVRTFCDTGPEAAARYQHALVGKLTGEEWGRLQLKHLDHHLRQFGA